MAPGDMLARMPMETSKTRDITGGLPRVAELFEARSPKDAGMLAEVTGTVSFGKGHTKGKQRLVIKDMDGVSHEYLIPKEKAVMAIDGQVVNKGELIVDGPADPTIFCVCWVWKRSPSTSLMKFKRFTDCRA